MAKNTVDNTMGRLVAPNGEVFGYSNPKGSLLDEKTNISELTGRFQAYRNNAEQFYHTVTEGTLLTGILGLTSSQNFMEDTLDKVGKEAGFANNWVKFLHGHDTKWSSINAILPWVSIYANYFTSIPIPENLNAVSESQASLEKLAKIRENNSSFYEETLKGVKPIDLQSGSEFKIRDLNGLEFTVFNGDNPVRPQMISGENNIIYDGDRILYNGLPKDRSKFPSLLMNESDNISLRIKNITEDKLYLITPTINGIPMSVDEISFYTDGFSHNPLPIAHIDPLKTYIKPGEEKDFTNFFVNRINLTNSRNHSHDIDLDLSRKQELAFALGNTFDVNLSYESKNILNNIEDDHLREKTIHESRLDGVHRLIDHLKKAKKCDIYLSRSVIADSKSSNELDNPMLGSLGSLGFTVMEVTPAPRKSEHQHSHFQSNEYAYQFDGNTRGMGMGSAGLATIAGSADKSATKVDFWIQFDHDDMLHTFKAYSTVNLLSAKD